VNFFSAVHGKGEQKYSKNDIFLVTNAFLYTTGFFLNTIPESEGKPLSEKISSGIFRKAKKSEEYDCIEICTKSC